jgi:hypothetical protein
MTIKSRVEKLEGQILPPGWLERLERKLIIGTISDVELEKLEGYYRHLDPEGMQAIDAQVSVMTDAIWLTSSWITTMASRQERSRSRARRLPIS